MSLLRGIHRCGPMAWPCWCDISEGLAEHHARFHLPVLCFWERLQLLHTASTMLLNMRHCRRLPLYDQHHKAVHQPFGVLLKDCTPRVSLFYVEPGVHCIVVHAHACLACCSTALVQVLG